MQDAQIAGSQILLRSAISYEAAARASNDKKAFVRATSLLVENMLNSISKRLEIALIYGQSAKGLGEIESVDSTGADSCIVTIATSQWAPGIWAGSDNAKVTVYVWASATDAYATTGSAAEFTVSLVDLVNRKMTLTGTAGSCGNLRDDVSGSDPVVMFFTTAVSGTAGAFTAKEFAGIDRIVSNSGSLFNINAATYALWRGNSYSAGSAALSLTKILNAVALGVERGLDEDVVCLMSSKTWANIASDQAALRVYDQSYKPSKLENGSSDFVFNGQNGRIEIHTSIFVKEGECFILPVKRFKRVGAIDTTFKMPGRSQQEDFFLELASQAGYELRCYTDQALFCEAPAKCVKIVNIVNS